MLCNRIVPWVGMLLAFFLCVGQLMAGEVVDKVTVLACGTGKTEEAALKQAFSNAVTQVVGTIVDAETIVKNDKVIKEQILTYSNAIITKYDTVGKPVQADGLITVTINAQVEKKTITDMLIANKVASAPVEGKDLMARALTELKAEQDGTKMLTKLFAALPCIVNAQPYGEPEIAEKTEAKVTLNVKIACSVDQKKYAAWVEAAKPILQKMAIRTVRDRWSNDDVKKFDETLGGESSRGDFIKDWGMEENRRSHREFLLPIEDINAGKCFYSNYSNRLFPEWVGMNSSDDERAIVIHDNPGRANGSYTVYYMKKKLYEAVMPRRFMPEHEVLLCDKTGAELAGVKLASCDPKRNCWVGIYPGNTWTCHISPNTFPQHGIYFAPRYVVEIMFDLPIDKLKEVKSVNVKAMESKSENN